MKVYPSEQTETLLDGHVSAFAFLGGVPRSILYDSVTLTVARILGDGTRQRTRAFTHLQGAGRLEGSVFHRHPTHEAERHQKPHAGHVAQALEPILRTRAPLPPCC